MKSNASGTESGIDRRTIRAARESMTVVPSGKGRFEVYSGTRGVYSVDLVTGECSCPDVKHNNPADGCKHLRRVEMEAGIREIPEQLGNCDARLMRAARDRRTNASSAEPVALADGGAVLPPETRGESPEGGCPHAHPDCEVGTGKERPVMYWECFEESRR